MRPGNMGNCVGRGFVDFEDGNAARAAFNAVRRGLVMVRGMPVRAELRRTRPDRQTQSPPRFKRQRWSDEEVEEDNEDEDEEDRPPQAKRVRREFI